MAVDRRKTKETEATILALQNKKWVEVNKATIV